MKTKILTDFQICISVPLNSRSRPELKIPSIKRQKFLTFLLTPYSLLWNSMPYEIRRIKRWTLDSSKCRICKPYGASLGLI